MIQVGTWHWWLYGGLCLAVLTSCVWIAISPHKAAPLAILLCTATLYHCFAFGVRDTVVSCNQFVDQTGNQIVLATKLYALQNQHLPTHLAQLSPQYLPTLATPPTHTPWHYRIRTDQNHFGLEFLGPLNFTYSYSSRSDRWNTLTPP